MNKRGFELALNTLVILILAVVVLVALVLFFTGNFESFSSKLQSFSSYSNVDQVKATCNTLSDTDSVYAYCCEKRNVKYIDGNEKAEGDFTCDELRTGDIIGDLIKKIDCQDVCMDSIPNDSTGGSGDFILNEETCQESGGRWNSCGNVCSIMNQGNTDVACLQVCDEICECGTIAGLGCPEGYICVMPEGVDDALGYCAREK